jgi:hypothetical protein
VLITETEPKKFRREVSVPFTGIMYVRTLGLSENGLRLFFKTTRVCQ